MALQESGEMYLETIHVLSKESTGVRSVDIGAHMGYSKPSVSRAVGLLKSGGFINVDKDGYITLTDSGKEIAEKIYDRHTTLTKLLIKGIGIAGFIYLITGGIAYTVGAIIYGVSGKGKHIKYMHSVFHLFVVAAAVLQFFSIFFYCINR